MASNEMLEDIPTHELLRENLTGSIMEKARRSLRKRPAPKEKKEPVPKVKKKRAKVFTLHKCRVCKKEYDNKNLLNIHMSSHSSDRPYSCPQCTKTFKCQQYLTTHIKKVHIGDKKYVCDLCPMAFIYPCKLASHRRVHTGEKPYKCNICDKTFSASYCLNMHKYIHTKEKPFKCPYCDYACRDNSTLRKHKQRHIGTKEKYYKCKLCDKQYKEKSTLKFHVAEAHLKMDNIRKFECDTCNTKFRFKHTLVYHIRSVHDKSMTVECEICHVTATNKYNLIAHMRTHVDVRPYRCRVDGCGMTYKDGSSLTKHSKRHGRPIDYKTCEYCQMSFITKQDLKDHMRSEHTLDIEKYICDYCKFKTKRKTNLVLHIKHKHMTKNYKCRYCKRVYILKHFYLRHKCEDQSIGVEKEIELKKTTKEIVLKEEPQSDNDELYLEMNYKDIIDDLKDSSQTNHNNTYTSHLDNITIKDITSLSTKQNEPNNLLDNAQNAITNVKHNAVNEKQSKTTDKEIELNNDIEADKRVNLETEMNIQEYNIVKEENKNKRSTRDLIKFEETNATTDLKINSNIIEEDNDSEGENKKKIAKKKREKDISKEKDGNEKSFADLMNEFGVNIEDMVVTNDNANKDLAEVIMENQTKKIDEIPKEIFDEYFIENISEDDLKASSSRDQTEDAIVQERVKEMISKRNEKFIVRDKKTLKRFSKSEVEEIMEKHKSAELNQNQTENTAVKSKKIIKKKTVRNTRKDKKIKKKSKGNGTDKEKPKKIRKKGFDKNRDVKRKDNETLADKLTKNMHQCYVCLKVMDTRAKLINHCKQHFDLCSESTLKKCPLCDHVTYLGLNTHLQRKHNIKLKYSYSKIYQKKDKNGLKFFFKVDHPKFDRIEIIPSIRHLNKYASMRIDKKNRENKNKIVLKNKLVKKDTGWIVEEEKVDIKDGYTVLKADGNVNGEYIEKMKVLYKEAKKKGEKIVFPCKNCDKVCLTLSALKLHHRKHDVNAKPFKKKVWKHKIKNKDNNKVENGLKDKNKAKIDKVIVDKDNRLAKPKPIKNKHKCDPALKKFYESNINGGDIEFWQFLKIFNKMGREKVENFDDLETRTDFGVHKIVDSSEVDKAINNNQVKNNIKKNINRGIKKVLNLTRQEYLKRLSVQRQLREKIASNKVL